MPRSATSQNQRWPFWSHFFSVVISIAAGVLIYWISGGFPPTTWQMLWLVLSQVQMLWRHGALAVVLQLVILGIQSLLLVFAWVVCLWIICIEVLAFVKYVFEPLLLRSILLSELVDNLYFVVRAPLRIFSREQTFPTNGGADSSLALSAGANLAPPAGSADGQAQAGVFSNTIDPFAPDHQRWFQPSPEPFATSLQKIFTGKFPALPVQGFDNDGAVKANGNSKPLSEEAILQNPFEEPKDRSLQNSFEEPEGDVLQNAFEGPKQVSWNNPFEGQEEERGQDPFGPHFTENRDLADLETFVSTDVSPAESEEQNEDTAPSARSGEPLMADNTATLPGDLQAEEEDKPIAATSTSTSTPTVATGQPLLAGYCAEPEETAGDTAHLELCATRTTLAGVSLVSGLYMIVSSAGETGSDDTTSARVVKTMREQLEPLQRGTCSNEALKELFFVTGQRVYEQFLQKAQGQDEGQKNNYTLTGVLVLQEPGGEHDKAVPAERGQGGHNKEGLGYTVHVVHTGSSQLYCYSASKGLTRITNDDEVETLLTVQSLTGKEGQSGVSQSEGPSWHMEGSTITKISTFSLPLQPRDRLLLCGSGLWNALLDRELTAFLALPVRNPTQVVMLLQQAAIEANHKKQVMAIVVFIPE